MTKPLLDKSKELFSILENAAITDAECPKNDTLSTQLGCSVDHLFRNLVQADYIETHTYKPTFRVVIIKHGPHAGESTKKPTVGRKVKITAADVDTSTFRQPKALEIPEWRS